jgi:hypothetical protein
MTYTLDDIKTIRLDDEDGAYVWGHTLETDKGKLSGKSILDMALSFKARDRNALINQEQGLIMDEMLRKANAR